MLRHPQQAEEKKTPDMTLHTGQTNHLSVDKHGLGPDLHRLDPGLRPRPLQGSGASHPAVPGALYALGESGGFRPPARLRLLQLFK